MENSTFIPEPKSNIDTNFTTQPPLLFFYGYVLDKKKNPIRALIKNLMNNDMTYTDASGFYRISGNIGDKIEITAEGFNDVYSSLSESNENDKENGTTVVIMEPKTSYNPIPVIVFCISTVFLTLFIPLYYRDFISLAKFYRKEIWEWWCYSAGLSFVSGIFSGFIPVGIGFASLFFIIFLAASATLIDYFRKKKQKIIQMIRQQSSSSY